MATHSLLNLCEDLIKPYINNQDDDIKQTFQYEIDSEANTRADADAALLQAIHDAAIVPAGSTIVVDSSLSISGAAADAKVTGDKFNVLKNITNCEALDYEEGVGFDLSSTSVTMDGGLPQGITTSGIKCAYKTCSEGDVFTINSNLSNTSAMCYGFINSSGVLLSVSPVGLLMNDFLAVAPSNAAFILVNDRATSTVPSYKGITAKALIGLIDELDEDIDYKTGVEEITYNMYQYAANNPVTMVDGVPVSNGANSSYKCAIVPCSEGDIFVINGQSNNSNLRCYGIANANGVMIQQSPGTYTANNLVITCPANSAWLVLNSIDLTAKSYKGLSLPVQIANIINTHKSDNDFDKKEISLVVNEFSSMVSPIELTDRTYADLQANSDAVVSSSVRKSVILRIVPKAKINIKKLQTVYAMLGFTTEYPQAGTVVNTWHSWNGVENTDIYYQAGFNDNYMIFTYFTSGSDTYTDAEIKASMKIYYASDDYGDYNIVVHADDKTLNLLKYRPIGRVSKPYIAISCDDGNAVLATYTIPRIQYWKQQYGIDIPVTFALMKGSEVMLDSSYKALVIDACENYGSAVAIHGLHAYSHYTRKGLADYLSMNENYLYSELGVMPNSIIYPEHYHTDFIQTLCGSFYGVCGCGGIRYDYAYSDESGRPFYIGEKSNCYQIYRLAIHDGRITSLSDVEDIVDYAYDHNYIICPYFHDVDLGDSAPNKDYLRGILDKFVSYGVSKGIDFVKLGDIPHLL